MYGKGQGAVAKLVTTEPRFLLQKGTTGSVPLAAAMVDTLESTGKLPACSASAKTLRQWFRRNFEAAWTKLAAERSAQVFPRHVPFRNARQGPLD